MRFYFKHPKGNTLFRILQEIIADFLFDANPAAYELFGNADR